MTKKELIAKHEEGQLKEIAIHGISNVSGVAICHIEYGIEEKVFGYETCGDRKEYFMVKLKYLATKIVFNVGKSRYDFGSFMRV